MYFENAFIFTVKAAEINRRERVLKAEAEDYRAPMLPREYLRDGLAFEQMWLVSSVGGFSRLSTFRGN